MSHSFQRSKRSSELLDYLVAHSLEENAPDLRGKIIAQDVFDRFNSETDPDDTIVRVSVAKLRRMLKLYYHEVGTESEIEISIPKGTYNIEVKRRNPVPKLGTSNADRKRPLFTYAAVALVALLLPLTALLIRPPEPSLNISDYPTILVQAFENKTEDAAYDSLGTAFQEQLVFDLQRCIIRAEATDIAKETPATHPPGYRITGEIFSVMPELNLIVELTETQTGKVTLRQRIIQDSREETYFTLLEKISADLSYNVASAEGEIIRTEMARMREQNAAGTHIAERFSAFLCYGVVLKYYDAPTQQSFETAFQCLTEELDKNPDDPILSPELALLENNMAFFIDNPVYRTNHPVFGEMDMDKPVSAASAYARVQRAIKMNPAHDTPLAVMGQIYLGDRKLPEAAHYLRQALELNPGNPQYHSAYSRILAYQGQWDAAIAHAEEAIARSITPDGRDYLPMFLHAVLQGDGETAQTYLPKMEPYFGGYMNAMHDFVVASLVNDEEKIAFWKPQLILNGSNFDGDPLHMMKANGGSDEIFAAFQTELERRGVVDPVKISAK